jgi:hypothetical protein
MVNFPSPLLLVLPNSTPFVSGSCKAQKAAPTWTAKKTEPINWKDAFPDIKYGLIKPPILATAFVAE